MARRNNRKIFLRGTISRKPETAPRLVIEGGVPLQGTLRIKGAKNAALPVLAGCLLASGEITLNEIPRLEDVQTMTRLLKLMGAEIQTDFSRNRLFLSTERLHTITAPPGPVRCMRASFLIVGPLLARLGRICISRPGGCAIGTRPIDLHLKGLQALGAEFSLEGGLICLEVRGHLRGEQIYLDYPSVGATENIMMAACLAEGTTLLENAAAEPEVVDLANFLNSMGAHITGAGTSVIRIQGVNSLQGGRHTIIPDRIEAGTFMTAAALTGGDVLLENTLFQHVKPLTAKLREAGVLVEELDYGKIRVKSLDRPHAFDIKTLPYPGFPTDLQPQVMALLATAQGVSIISETVFEKRFRHAVELCRMGADIRLEGQTAIVKGKEFLNGASVRAADLRGAAALILAALGARGISRVYGLHHLDRGYADFESRLRSLGARIYRF
jgi:UDP-N-acetylglucosamine 1-carboxyvinyltransferase